uniref:Uncharacterized protein n=1 Tax=Clastoptera arizonana TaxID=38151 RepID=A0A1B6DXV8_9HEMI
MKDFSKNILTAKGIPENLINNNQLNDLQNNGTDTNKHANLEKHMAPKKNKISKSCSDIHKLDETIKYKSNFTISNLNKFKSDQTRSNPELLKVAKTKKHVTWKNYVEVFYPTKSYIENKKVVEQKIITEPLKDNCLNKRLQPRKSFKFNIFTKVKNLYKW